jgi:uncharacterized NAD-dependent epimerase/dehydratase family protein
MSRTATLLACDLYKTPFAKTSHALVRGPSRYRILAVVDSACAGEDAGELLDGRRRDIPVFASLKALLEAVDQKPEVCVVGVATVGGVLPPPIRTELLAAAEAGMTLVSGLHQILRDDTELARLTQEHGGQIIDIRRQRPASELRFWSGDILQVTTPRIAVLGTDCALGKRTTCSLLREACRRAGIRAEMVYTGQTGWLQGYPHGFILDATPNDFVCGELEKAILDCQNQTRPEVILLEGQSGLRNPAGPCGSELILAGGARGVVLQHAPGRRHFEDMEELGFRIPPLSEEIELIGLLGAEVWALTLNAEGLVPEETEETRRRLARQFGIPVVYPLSDGLSEVVGVIRKRLSLEAQ